MTISCSKQVHCDSIISSLILQNLAIYPSQYSTSILSTLLDSSNILFWANVNFQVIGQINERVLQFQGSGYSNSNVITIIYTTTTPYNIAFEGKVSGTITISTNQEALNAYPFTTITSTTGKGVTIVTIQIKAPEKSILHNFSYTLFRKCNQASNTTTRKIFFIGDSVTAGFHCEETPCNCNGIVSNTQLSLINANGTLTPNYFTLNNNCSASYEQFLIQYFQEDTQVYNFAIAGLTAANILVPGGGYYVGWSEFSSVAAFSDTPPNMLNRLLTQDIVNIQPDVIFISLGANDTVISYQDSNQFPPSSQVLCSQLNPTCGLVQATYKALADILNTLSPQYPNTIFIINRPMPLYGDGYNLQTMGNVYGNTLDSGIRQYLNNGVTFEYIDIYDEVTGAVSELGGINCSYCDTVHPNQNLNEKIGQYLAAKIANKNSNFSLVSGSSLNTNQPQMAYWYQPLTRSR